MAFFKLLEGILVTANNFVYGEGYTLLSEEKDTYSYPIDGWYWFETEEDARFNLISAKRVTRAQAKIALHSLGLLETLETIMANPATNKIYKIAWEDALYFDRNSPTITAIGQVLNLTDSEIDNIFKVAAGIDGF